VHPPQTSGYAIASLVTAFFCLGPVPVVLGHIALGKIKRAAGALQGQGMAIAGLVMGYIQLILLPLLIIPILFIGARAWKKGSDRAGCIMNQRNLQQAVRAYQSANGLHPGDPIDWAAVIGDELNYDRLPTCPEAGEYKCSDSIPREGEPAMECSISEHVPSDLTEW
jgi:hypothetical protein